MTRAAIRARQLTKTARRARHRARPGRCPEGRHSASGTLAARPRLARDPRRRQERRALATARARVDARRDVIRPRAPSLRGRVSREIRGVDRSDEGRGGGGEPGRRGRSVPLRRGSRGARERPPPAISHEIGRNRATDRRRLRLAVPQQANHAATASTCGAAPPTSRRRFFVLRLVTGQAPRRRRGVAAPHPPPLGVDSSFCAAAPPARRSRSGLLRRRTSTPSGLNRPFAAPQRAPFEG